jgi:hypothetical protein
MRHVAVVVAPTAVVGASVVAALTIALLGGTEQSVLLSGAGLLLGCALSIAALLFLLLRAHSDRLLLCVIMASLTFLSVIIGVAFLGLALHIACHGGTECPLG